MNITMKTKRLTLLTAAAIPALLFATGCGKNEPMVQSPAPSSREMPSVATPPTATMPGAAATAPMASANMSSARWDDIKDSAFDARATFMTGLKALEAKVDAQITELKAQRAAMQGSPSSKDWDFAMKEMADARTYLKSTGEELSKATSETWAQQKEKVGQAWVRTQDAYAKVKSSTTG